MITGEILNSLIDKTRNKIFITSMQLSISLFNQRNPKLINISAMTINRFFSCFIDWNTLINKNINPLIVFKKSNNIKPNLAIFLENERVYTLTKLISYVSVNNHSWSQVSNINLSSEKIFSQSKLR